MYLALFNLLVMTAVVLGLTEQRKMMRVCPAGINAGKSPGRFTSILIDWRQMGGEGQKKERKRKTDFLFLSYRFHFQPPVAF